MSGPIETAFRAKRDAGRKLLVPYVTGGLGRDWIDVVQAVAEAGADAVEVGIPFSDPVMDGPVVQRASAQALADGATPKSVLAGLTGLEVPVPVAVMTYYNVVFRPGPAHFADALFRAGVSGAILPDLPVDELDEWSGAAEACGVETILLAAPSTPDDRLRLICTRSRGWIYAVAVMGVTGERASLAASAAVMGARLKACTDKPVLLGVGVSTPEQAAEAASAADGVIVGSALVRRLLEGVGPKGAAEFVGELRAGLDAGM
ncbi:MAG: tryptophan synthase subunit alpha [Actinomycetota bacterium]|nr:tryptophan synthase subunit alpha [Actinomycetota bacterium]